MKHIEIRYVEFDEVGNPTTEVFMVRHPDATVTSFLNVFSETLRAVGYSYGNVGVAGKLSNGETVEHWSEY